MSGTKHLLHFSIITAFIALLILSIDGCSPMQQLASKWSENPVRMDGSLADWADSTVFVEKDGIRYGVANDGEFLYLCLISSKANLGRQIMFRGMTIWFDPNGGDKKTIGIRFPIGGTGMGRPEMGQQQPDQDPEQRGDRLEEMERQSLNEFEYLGPGENDRIRVSRLQGQGLEMHMTATPERFLYKLKIPLQYSSQHPYAVETHSGAKIGLGIESNTAARMAQGGPGGEGRGEGTEGGRPGAGGGRMQGGMGRGGQRPGGSAATVNFSIWSRVQLAEKAR
ncbi:MAG: hypothetical protein NTZ35_17800 [Ignavibacteriales bacterium]|nr:hypothetical protein [Ignavibacteriales bacterium]